MSVYYDMAIDAGAVSEEERWHMAAQIEEEHRQMEEQQYFEDFMAQQQINELLDPVRSDVVIHILPCVIEESPDTKGS